jgi:hypothetical membrane protein
MPVGTPADIQEHCPRGQAAHTIGLQVADHGAARRRHERASIQGAILTMNLAHPITRARARTGSPTRLAGSALFVLAAQFMIVIMLGASIAPGYDMAVDAISDLGAIHETAMLFNLSLLAVGVLNLVGGLLLLRGRRRPVLLSVFVIAAIGAIGTGLFPLNSGGPHGLFALVAFLAFNLEAIGIATLVRGPMRAISILAGVSGLAFLVLMAIGDAGNAAAFGPIGHGGTERMIAYPPMLWMLAFGGYLLAAAEVLDDREPTRP